jgi:glycosyltransferase involved in cell wall biosynthesis
MAAGLPVLVSAAAGAAQLVSHGQNGWVFQPWKATQIAACMEVAHHSNLQAVSEAALRRIDPYTPARFAEALLDAVHAGDHHRRSRERRRESTVLWAVPAPGAYVRPRAPEKIAVLIERLGPYHVARMRAVGAVWGEDRCVAIEIAAHSKEYEWDQVAGDGFLRRTLVPDRVYQELTACEVMRATDRALSEERPDIVAVNGWRSPEARAAVLWCKRNSRPAILMSASQFQDAPRLWARELMKSWRLRAYDSALVGGTSQLNYAIKLGMDPERVVTGYNVVDNQHFADGAAAARGAEARLRVQLNLPKRYFMSVVRFLPRKGLETLLEAYALYRNDAGQGAWDLVILGDGELRPKLLAMSRLLGLELWVQWPGFKQYDELPAYYGLASAFVLPSSREQWGLVVNEAMAAGLPVVVSRRCGCAPDLVVHGRNGFTFDAGDAAALARALRDMTEADLESMRKESQRTISAWTPAAFAGNLARASSLARGYASSRRRRVFAPLFWF